ncbi:hypothetical protein CO112_03600 [Candidatus Dojkabacteria bacterium CG_4_9_14_3_um_filter_150_Dojkabacteria_WS6_41_13]|uniref:Uncharacterized protein n=1 Tax=Candidatus Dojkabacteria bacterium CG_4_10_14_0_2_um_filter_Dojkabacteria_WS6_41_15 TaxID=2014249 RepID=A0A2M7W124_9BACT|nr:MAG: hypothetical protein COX64_04175 [Candidatus Dojkabacteria bacterium CG_4_10_14_0_2_um_filter_Dojkabacteria_WS6_41_15]PJB22585.1 MAG: hypothetical protein CO112_03600 [Candidatus Dojkabacteria bacterium CG_4_9_14_3_um_filter_150_Dojkabacteria_WS6_41_13]
MSNRIANRGNANPSTYLNAPLQAEICKVVKEAGIERRFGIMKGIPLITRTLAGLELKDTSPWQWGMPPINTAKPWLWTEQRTAQGRFLLAFQSPYVSSPNVLLRFIPKQDLQPQSVTLIGSCARKNPRLDAIWLDLMYKTKLTQVTLLTFPHRRSYVVPTIHNDVRLGHLMAQWIIKPSDEIVYKFLHKVRNGEPRNNNDI